MKLNSKILFIIIAVVTPCILIGSIIVMQNNRTESTQDSGVQEIRNNQSEQAQTQAIQEAQQWLQGEGSSRPCAQVVTPAVHTETGATYTFNSGCIPPGWEANY